MTANTDNSFRSDVIKLILALVFVFGFLVTAGFTLIRYADEGPSVRYVPPAYNLSHTN